MVFDGFEVGIRSGEFSCFGDQAAASADESVNQRCIQCKRNNRFTSSFSTTRPPQHPPLSSHSRKSLTSDHFPAASSHRQNDVPI